MTSLQVGAVILSCLSIGFKGASANEQRLVSLPPSLTATAALEDPRKAFGEADKFVSNGRLTPAAEDFSRRLTDRILNHIVTDFQLKAPEAHRLRPVAHNDPKALHYDTMHYACIDNTIYDYHGKLELGKPTQSYVGAADDATLIFRITGLPITFKGEVDNPRVGAISATALVNVGTICGLINRWNAGTNKFECSHYVDIQRATEISFDHPTEAGKQAVKNEIERSIAYTMQQILTIAWDAVLVDGPNTTHEYRGTGISTATADKSYSQELIHALKQFKKPTYEVVDIKKITAAIEKENAEWQNSKSGPVLMCQQCQDAMEKFTLKKCTYILASEKFY